MDGSSCLVLFTCLIGTSDTQRVAEVITRVQ